MSRHVVVIGGGAAGFFAAIACAESLKGRGAVTLLEATQHMLAKVRATAEWKDYMEKGAFNQTSMTGDQFNQWLGKAENDHRELMKEAGFLAK